MDDYIEIHRDERHIKREREKAREKPVNCAKVPFFKSFCARASVIIAAVNLLPKN